VLAFSADNETGRFQLWLAAADGASGRALTTAGDWQQPFWSPDGRRLVASAKLGNDGFQILVIDAIGVDGSTAQRIEQPEGDNVHPAWSPDGRSIVFTVGRGDGSAVWRFDFAS
jgi:TolB protein